MPKQKHFSEIDSQLVLEALAIEMKLLRAKLQITQEQLALRADVNRTFVGKVESRTSQPSLLVLMRLVAALEISLPDFASALVKRVEALERVANRSGSSTVSKKRGAA